MAALEKPCKEAIRAARVSAGLTQAEAATLIHRRRERWAEFESGARNMGLESWELFLIKSGQMPPA